jgi:hypothetical protein
LNRNIVAAKTSAVLYQSPCETPKAYSIGSVDERFNLSRSELEAEIAEAAAIWGAAYGKDLFVYDPESPFTINFIYDDRQSLNEEINHLNDELKEEDQALKPKIDAYKKRSAELKEKIEALNQEIQSWNDKGGAPPDVYEGLLNRQKALRQESEELNALATSLSLTTEDYNSRVSELDRTVETYNETLTFKPEGGKYMLDANGEKIEIYIYDSRDELVNVLAHELGHSLGMDHANDPKAIMFSKSNSALTLSADDLAFLSQSCKKQNVILMKYKLLGYALQQTLSKYIDK